MSAQIIPLKGVTAEQRKKAKELEQLKQKQIDQSLVLDKAIRFLVASEGRLPTNLSIDWLEPGGSFEIVIEWE